MVPSQFVILEELPLTSTGKVDRSALPAPDPMRPELDDRYEAPRTSVERVLTGIWQELLELERIGVNDNFFVLGGHSLLATRLVSSIRAELDVRLPLRRVFEAPTISQLAVAIDDCAATEGTTPPATVLRPYKALKG
jgi:acyl carrier protein